MSTAHWIHCLLGLLVAFSAEERRDLTIAGYWTLNHELSDQAPSVPETANPESAGALLSELLALHEHLTVAPTGQGTITIVDGHAVSRVYDTAGRPELQKCQAGTAKTRTVREGPWLRQEIQLHKALRIVRTLQSAEDRLIETIAVETQAGPVGRPLIRVYESDRVR